jgi:hypothetical protein
MAPGRDEAHWVQIVTQFVLAQLVIWLSHVGQLENT